ncbi:MULTISPECIES: hypothetical protein [Trichocoleus]|uniref:Uncharacterized protein n=1 Tax=Trichocoleus desertorum GB2-A4 TaxID=2933944 RepID=A0ABV0JEX7_9CYAN|nr:hypothetical protein [Trichocoleus sp. FACHB-46]MBD1865129.1 hypothetical protein [Trichocoleus sp. FACHB-46]
MKGRDQNAAIAPLDFSACEEVLYVFLQTLPKTNSDVLFVVRLKPLRTQAIAPPTMPKLVIFGIVDVPATQL